VEKGRSGFLSTDPVVRPERCPDVLQGVEKVACIEDSCPVQSIEDKNISVRKNGGCGI
jgi:hypothetical protein